jgi:type VI secretion system secreted protein Hcp
MATFPVSVKSGGNPMAQIYAFLDLDGVEGESQDADYTNKIELQGVSWGVTNASSYAHGTGPGIGQGDVADILCSKYFDKSSFTLFDKCTTGKPISSGKVTLLKQSGETKVPYIQLKLTNVIIKDFHFHAGNDGKLPLDTFSLHFVKHESSYKPQGNEGDPQGNIDISWDIQKNTK